MSGPRSLSELKIRATAHERIHRLSEKVDKELLSEISEGKISPARTFNLVFAKTQCFACAKAARWLAMIARDYGVEEAKKVLIELS